MEPFREPSLSQAVPWSTGNISQPLVEAQGASCTLRLLAGVDAGAETMGKGEHLCFLTNTRLSPQRYQLPEAMSLHQAGRLIPSRPFRRGLGAQTSKRPPVEISVLQPLAKSTGEMTGWGKDRRGPPRTGNRPGPPGDLMNPSPSGLGQVSFQVMGGESGQSRGTVRPSLPLNEYKCLIHGRKSFPGFHPPDK